MQHSGHILLIQKVVLSWESVSWDTVSSPVLGQGCVLGFA